MAGRGYFNISQGTRVTEEGGHAKRDKSLEQERFLGSSTRPAQLVRYSVFTSYGIETRICISRVYTY